MIGERLNGDRWSTGDRYVGPSVVDAVGRASHVVPLVGWLPITPCSEAGVTSFRSAVVSGVTSRRLRFPRPLVAWVWAPVLLPNLGGPGP